MQVVKPTVVLSDDMKSVTVVGANGNRTTVVAQATLSVWYRKDGGVTLRSDQNHQSQTVRLDCYGRLFNGKRPKA